MVHGSRVEGAVVMVMVMGYHYSVEAREEESRTWSL